MNNDKNEFLSIDMVTFIQVATFYGEEMKLDKQFHCILSNHKKSNQNITFRNSILSDQEIVSTLIAESSIGAFSYIFEGCSKSFKEFLKFACFREKGLFGYKNQKVGCINGKIVIASTVYSGNKMKKHFIETIMQLFIFYKLRDFIKILSRVFQIRKSFTCPHKESIYLANLCTISNFRGQGIGTDFIKYIINFAKKFNYNSVELDVYLNNDKAIRLYERIGFKIKRINKFRKNNIFNTVNMRLDVR